jgi:hypothetical protein
MTETTKILIIFSEFIFLPPTSLFSGMKMSAALDTDQYIRY